MSIRILQTFKADVYGNIVTSPMLYDIISTLHDAMQDNEHDVLFDDDHVDMHSFMGDLMYAIERFWLNCEYFNQGDLESGLSACISDCENFQDLCFFVNGSEYCFEYINYKIQNGEYSK